ncbi:MAG TPA: AAA family ATPase [Anaerolineae bacterium]|nr:AAA family ATPase [Anaerolineae bacterium]
MIIFTGLPGTGKSSIAEAVARELSIPIFAKDWLEATLIRCRLQPAEGAPSLGSAGYQLLTTLAERQLQLGQSVILDSVASTLSIRTEWRALAQTYQAKWRAIECICSDEATHRDRMNVRRRGIPGWHELDWSEVERVKAYYAPWDEERLILDAVQPLEENIAAALRYLRVQSIGSDQSNAI